jgi:hypothetical protein
LPTSIGESAIAEFRGVFCARRTPYRAIVKGDHDTIPLTLSKSAISATSPFAGNIHQKPMLKSTMKPIRSNTPTSKEQARESWTAMPGRSKPRPTQNRSHPSTHHASFHSNSDAITVPKPRQKQHLPYTVFARKRKIVKGMRAKILAPLPLPQFRRKNNRKKWRKSPANRTITTPTNDRKLHIPLSMVHKSYTHPG